MKNKLFAMDGLFARVMNHLWNLIFVSILWFVCCLPVFTVGAANTAAYYTAAKVVRRHNGTVFAEFMSAFRLNFKQATAFSLLQTVILALLVIDCVYFYGDAAQSSFLMLYLFYLMIAMVVACGSYFYPLLSRFSMTVFRFFRMSAVLMFRHLITTILLLLLLGVMLIGVYLMPWGILVFPGTMFWLQSFLMEPILLKYSPRPEEGSEEAAKWYYQ